MLTRKRQTSPRRQIFNNQKQSQVKYFARQKNRVAIVGIRQFNEGQQVIAVMPGTMLCVLRAACKGYAAAAEIHIRSMQAEEEGK
jgi:hypothetical protein